MCSILQGLRHTMSQSLRNLFLFQFVCMVLPIFVEQGTRYLRIGFDSPSTMPRVAHLLHLLRTWVISHFQIQNKVALTNIGSNTFLSHSCTNTFALSLPMKSIMQDTPLHLGSSSEANMLCILPLIMLETKVKMAILQMPDLQFQHPKFSIHNLPHSTQKEDHGPPSYSLVVVNKCLCKPPRHQIITNSLSFASTHIPKPQASMSFVTTHAMAQIRPLETIVCS